MKAILFLLFGIILIIPVSYGWEFGGFVAGDVFEYDICDEYTLDADTALRSKCYGVTLHVIDGFEMDFGYVWLLYVEVDNGELIRDIIVVDESFNVNSLNHKYIGDSIGNTLFWMPSHAGITDISLELGNTVYGSTGIFDEMVVTDFSREPTHTQYTVSTDSGNVIILRDDLYLPMSISMDTDMVTFDVQLNSMYNELEFSFVTTDDLHQGMDIPPTNIYNETDMDISAVNVTEISLILTDDVPENDLPKISLILTDDVPENDLPKISLIPPDDVPENDLPKISLIPPDDVPENDDLFGKLYNDLFLFFKSLFY